MDLAKLCAADGHDLVLVARSIGPMELLAAELSKRHGVGVRVLPADLALQGVGVRVPPADLADPAAPEAIHRAMEVGIEILINNAGFGVRGEFSATDWADETRLVQVNILALAHLTKLFLPG